MNSTATLTPTDRATAVLYEAPDVLTLTELPVPSVGPGDLVVEVLLCGVDGSELHEFRGEMEWLNQIAPVIFGDEIIGRVVAIGEDARRDRDLSEGDLITIESRWTCPEGCRNCDAGQYYLCERRGLNVGYGTIPVAQTPGLWGGYATHVFVPDYALVYRVPSTLPARTALIACSPLANGLRWTEHVSTDDHVVVIGPGTQGLASTVAAVSRGARVTLVGLDSDATRLEVGRDFGATATAVLQRGQSVEDAVAELEKVNGPVDAVIEVAGAPSAKALAVAAVRTRGFIVNVSVAKPATQPVDWISLLMKEVTLYNPVAHPGTIPAAFELAQDLLRRGLDVGAWVTHVYPLREAETALATAAYQNDERPVKVALDPSL